MLILQWINKVILYLASQWKPWEFYGPEKVKDNILLCGTHVGELALAQQQVQQQQQQQQQQSKYTNRN